jgi:hypothetical protein
VQKAVLQVVRLRYLKMYGLIPLSPDIEALTVFVIRFKVARIMTFGAIRSVDLRTRLWQ